MNARQSLVQVKYSGVDITKEVAEDLLSFSYTDNASGDADSITLSLKDHHKKWGNNWFPEKGDVLDAIIRTINWRKEGDKQALPCGRFFIDEPEYSGRPRELSIGAISAPINSNFKDAKRSRVWKNITLKTIAQDIAKRYGLSLQFIGKSNPKYQSIEQTETDDSSFLSQLCEDEGLAMKVTDNKIVIFDEHEFEKRHVVDTFNESNDRVLGYSFKSSSSNTAYAGVNVKYYDSSEGRKIEYLFAIKGIDDKSKIYQLNSKVRSGDEARRLAQKTLRKLNKKEYTGRLSVVGNVSLLGGSCVDLKGFGKFDGKYYITSATHTIDGGYTTEIEIRKVLEGY